MTDLKIDYVRVSTADQDLTAQHEALAASGLDHKLTYPQTAEAAPSVLRSRTVLSAASPSA